MDTEFLKDIQKNQHLFQDNVEMMDSEIALDKVLCPKCQSEDIVESRCNNCDFDLEFNPLGEPLGEKSFYTFREKYWANLTALELENPKIFQGDVKFRKFMVKVRRRYNNLLDYFYSEHSTNDELRALYLQELTDIVIEMMNSGVSETEIWRSYTAKGISETSLYDKIKSAITESRKDSNFDEYTGFFDYKMMGIFKVSTIMYILLLTVMVVGGTLALTSYLRAMN